MSHARFMKLATGRAHYFAPGEAPDKRTVRRAIDNHDLPGRVICGQYYIDVFRFEANHGRVAQHCNPLLVDKVLSGQH